MQYVEHCQLNPALLNLKKKKFASSPWKSGSNYWNLDIETIIVFFVKYRPVFYSLDKLKPKTKTLNNIVIFGIFHKE